MAVDPRRLADVFAIASELSAAEREAFLDRECGGDSELRQQVEALLQAHEATDSFPAGQQEPRMTGAYTPVPDTEERTIPPRADATTGRQSIATGTVIGGRYELVERLGEGGMGEVWVAKQSEPVKRHVALKLIKTGMDSKAVLARFEQEQQALAMMDHPNIARVLDAGLTLSGLPFFVMELVDGKPLTTFCDERKLTPRERLELFVPICQAVQHAHQKGIVHRDLKPSNILVTLVDGRPAPKVIDFGVAKATAGKLTDESLSTQFGAVLGTLEYMSPEQAGGEQDIDTRADIYSLGVILYELLTGLRPIDAKRLKQAALFEMVLIILEEEPSKPSTRLSTADALPSLAAMRRTEPNKLMAMLRGELDWVVMKCLEKQRERRYETANGLAMEIQRYLTGEAVLAAPPGNAYRLRKFIARNRATVIAGAAVAAALLIGAIGFAWQAHRAGIQRDAAITAQRSEAEQRRIAEEQKAVAEAQRNRAVTAEAEAQRRAGELQKVADFQGQMLAQVDPTTAGVRLSEDVRARFDAAVAKSGVPDGEREKQADLFAGQWSRVNATDTALELIDRTILKPAVAAIDKQFVDQPAVAATLRHVLAERYHDLGLDNAALALEQQALAERRRVLGEEHPDTLLSIGNLGAYLSGLGKKKEAEPYYREALEKSRRVRGDDHPETLVCIANMGSLLLDKGQLSDAEPFFREALEKRRRLLGEEDPDTLGSIHDWAALLREQGKLGEAERCYLEALAKRRRVLGEEHRKTLSSTNDLAVLLRNQGKLDESIKYFREVTEKKRRILGEVHPSTLSSIQSLGAVLDAAGHPVEAESLMREALAKQQRLLGADHASTLVTLGNLAVFLIGQNKFTEAEPICRETLDRRRRVLGDNHTATLIANNVMGLVLIRQDKLAEGEPYWLEALTIARRVLGPAHPETLVYMHNLGRLAIDQKKPAEAEKLFREVIQIGGPAIGAGHPTVLSATRRLAGMLLDQKRNAEVAELLSAAEATARKSYTGASERNLGAFLEQLGGARARLEQFAAAESNLVEAHTIYSKTRGPAHADTRNCTQLMIEFCAAWDKAEPGKGHDAKVAEWTAKLEAIKAAAPEPKPAVNKKP